MDVTMLTSSGAIDEMLHNAIQGALTCKGKGHKVDEVIPKVYLGSIIEQGHDSVLEHITVTYEVNGISRALLQELARHRHISLSVESTRSTLAERFSSDDTDLIADLCCAIDNNIILGKSGLKGCEVGDVLRTSFEVLADALGDLLDTIHGFSKEAMTDNEKRIVSECIKYFIPEAMPTQLVMTLNVRELRHILELRTSPHALLEFQALAYGLFQAFPDEYQWLLEDCVDDGVVERIKCGDKFCIEMEVLDDDDEEDEEDGDAF